MREMLGVAGVGGGRTGLVGVPEVLKQVDRTPSTVTRCAYAPNAQLICSFRIRLLVRSLAAIRRSCLYGASQSASRLPRRESKR